MGRRTYTAAQKAEALAVTAEAGSSIVAGRALGISDGTLRDWRREANMVRQAEGLPLLPRGLGGSCHNPEIPADWAAIMPLVAPFWARWARLGAERTIAQLENAPDPTTWRDRQALAIIAGIGADKLKLLAPPAWGSGPVTIDARRQTILSGLSDEQVRALAARVLDEEPAAPAIAAGRAAGGAREAGTRRGERRKRGGSASRRSNTSAQRGKRGVSRS